MLIHVTCFFHTDSKDLNDCYAASGYAKDALQGRALCPSASRMANVIGEADILKIF